MKIFLLFLFTFCFAENLLFKSISHEVPNEIEIPIQGNIPDWLDGTLYRNGFGKFEGEGFKFNHLFDALSLLLKIRINDGKVYFMTKLQNSRYYRESIKGIPTYRTLGGISPEMTVKEKMETLLHMNHDNYNANLIRLGPHLTAITDMLGSMLINDENLDFIGKYPFNDSPLEMISSAHPVYLPNAPHLQYNYKSVMIPFPKYKFYVVDTSKEEPYVRDYIVEIPVKHLSYVHSFTLTENYIIFVAYPFYWNVKDIMLSTAILPTMKWHQEENTFIYVINIKKRNVERKFMVDSFFGFHHVNGWEEGHMLYFDMIVYNNSDCVHDFYINKIVNSSGFIGGNLRKYRIDMLNGVIGWDEYWEYRMEMPMINIEYRGRRNEYFYGMGNKEGVYPSILKVNRNNGSVVEWKEAGHFPSEPIFVFNGGLEDNGIILSVVLDEKRKESYLLVLNARDMREYGRVYFNMSIPLSCHGFFE